nr:glycosyl hydrolase [Candidatus Sigynarchaeota archaeon]
MKNSQIFRWKAVGIILWLCIFTNVVALTSMAFPRVVAASPISFDTAVIPIKDQMCISHGPADINYHAENLKILGPKILRNNIEWFRCAIDYGKNTTVYDFSYYDTLFTNLLNRGIESLGCFVYGWGWWPNDYDLPREDWPFYYNFTRAFVLQYAGILKYYEIWNEPNIGFWRGTDEDFFEFSQKLASIVRSCDPNAIIISPGIVGPEVSYLDQMIAWYGEENFSATYDIIAYHAYSGRNAELLSQKMADVKLWMESHGLELKPVWITEIGMATSVATNDQIGTAIATELRLYQATQVLKVYAQAIAANISATFWYCQNDWCDTNDTYGEGRFGLMECIDPVHYLYGFKPAGYAYTLLNSLIENGTCYANGVAVRSFTGGTVSSYYFYTPRNTTVLILWSQYTAAWARLSVIAPEGSSGSAMLFDLNDFDYFTNSSASFPGLPAYEMELGFTPVLLELNYSAGMALQAPLGILIEIVYSPDIVALLVIIATISIAGLAILLARVRILRKKPTASRGGSP